MNIRKYFNVWVWAIGSLMVAVTLGQSQPQSRYLPSTSFDLANVQQGEVVEHRFTILNPGPSIIKLRIVELSHPGMKVRMPQELPAGQTGSITITWDTRSVQGDTTAQALLLFNEAESAIVSLSAKVIPPIDILPYPVVFISGFQGEVVTRTLEIVDNDSAPLNVTGISRENGDSIRSYSATFKTLEPGRRHQLNIELKSEAPLGRSQDVLLVQTDHARFPVLRIPVNLLVKSDVYINPESVDFGEITAEDRSPETFLLKTRNRPIKVLSVRSDLSFIRVKEANPNPASTHEFSVEIEGNPAAGRFSGNIYIRTDDPEFPELKAPVEGEILTK